MSFQVLLAEEAGGKTTAILQRIRQELELNQIRRIWLIVPNRRQIKTLQSQLANSGGMLGVSVGLFYQFAEEIFLKSNRNKTQMPETMVYRLVVEVIRQFSLEDRLGKYERIKDKPGFVEVLQNVFSELIQAGYQPGSQKNYDPALGILLDLFQEYLKKLDQSNWIDPLAMVSTAIKSLSKDAQALKSIDMVVVDGFDRLLKPQQDLLRLIAGQGVPVVLTLPVDPNDEGRVVYLSGSKTLRQLRAAVPDLKINTLSGKRYLPETVLAISRDFMQTNGQKQHQGDDLRLLSAHSPLQEVREVLRHFKKLIVLENTKPVDCAILIPDKSLYQPLLQAAAEEYGVPLQFTWRQSLSDQAEVRSVIDLLEMIKGDFPRRIFLNLLKSPFLDFSAFGFLPGDGTILERVSRRGPVISGLENWMKALQQMAQTGSDEEIALEEEDEPTPGLPNPAECIRLVGALERFAGRIKPADEVQAMAVWVKWLMELLSELNWLPNIVHPAEASWIEKVRLIFTELSLDDWQKMPWLVDFQQFVTDLSLVLKTSSFNPDHQPGCIQVINLTEARGSRFKHVAIPGLAEGIMPKVKREDPFLGDEFRLDAGLETRLDQDQIGSFFRGLTRCENSLILSRPYLSPAGDPLEPSPYWQGVLACLQTPRVEEVRNASLRDLSQAASLEELFFWKNLFDQSISSQEDDIQATATRLNDLEKVLKARQEKRPAGEYEGELDSLPVELHKFIQPHTSWSASRMETYNTCPLLFWTQYGLELAEERIPEAGMQSFQVGNILHEILETVYQSLDDKSDVEQLLDALESVAQPIFDQAPQEYHFEPGPYYQTQQKEWLMLLRAVIEGTQSPVWTPTAFELRFGLDGKPALEIELNGGGKLRFHGVIDRVDLSEEGTLRVIDYKTGSSNLDKESLVKGIRLQLPLYAMAASQIFSGREVDDAFYWTINGRKGMLYLNKFAYGEFEGPRGAMEIVRQHIEDGYNGIKAGSFKPKPPKGGCPDYCPARLWCWRYKPRRIG